MMEEDSASLASSSRSRPSYDERVKKHLDQISSRKRKKYLGQDATFQIPERSKRRYEQEDRTSQPAESSSLSSTVSTSPASMHLPTSASVVQQFSPSGTLNSISRLDECLEE